jgi:serine/threonine protein kinase
MKVAMATGTVAGQERAGFTPPDIAELAQKFPQLEIIELIGRGGMGAVYKARQKELDRIVALKILPPGIGDDAAFAERFAREAKALARLNHPGIVTIHDFGRADGLYFFVMEYVDGVNLRQLLAGGRVSPREALAIVPQICDALQFAHDQGIVHRDIKPENILLDRHGRVKVADFGLAKIVGKDAGLANPPGEARAAAAGDAAQGPGGLTDAGKVLGTPAYMAPEQVEHPGEVDHRADIYALGVVFYQMLTGELPGKRIEAPSKKVQIDVRLDDVVLRALEKKPELRYQQVSEVKTMVETILGDTGAPAVAPSPIPPPQQDKKGPQPMQRPTSVTVFGILNIGFAVLGVFGLIVTSVIFMVVGGLLHQSPPFVIWFYVTIPLGLLSRTAELVAGIGLLGLRPWARTLSIVYAIYAIVINIFDMIIGPFISLAPLLAQQQHADARAAAVMDPLVVGVLGMVIGFFRLIYPVLLLLFMTRPKMVAAFHPPARVQV